ncbi:MAG: VOC family protein [Ktedonobacteraceae bacterium]
MDLAAAKDFYADKIGLRVLSESPGGVTFQCGGDTQLVVTKSSVGTKDEQTQAAFRVADVRAEVSHILLDIGGYRFYRSPFEGNHFGECCHQFISFSLYGMFFLFSSFLFSACGNASDVLHASRAHRRMRLAACRGALVICPASLE